MKVHVLVALVFALSGIAKADEWLTDSKKAIELAKTDKKPLIIFVSKSDTKMTGEFSKSSKLKDAVLLKIELGTKDEEEWAKSSIIRLAGGKNTFYLMDLKSLDSSGKFLSSTAYQPLESIKEISWADVEEWYQPPVKEKVVAKEAGKDEAKVANTYQEIAQARADAMAAMNRKGCTHIIPGAPLKPGDVWEGVGWHSTQGGTPGTCTFNKAVIADAIAIGPYGTYRVRFFK